MAGIRLINERGTLSMKEMSIRRWGDEIGEE